ncbi:MAG: hypothetical protein CSA79_04740 [Thiothrix nivea]|nr:MAG: hypothetical protein CSA79_04740 [Thiothrix nivea]
MGLHKVVVVLLHALVAGFIVACGGERAGEGNITAPETPLFTLSADGVGPLNAETPFNLVQIGDAFQNYNVAQETHLRDAGQYPVITVRQRDELLLSINADYKEQRVFSIIVHDNRVGNELGHRLGDRFNEIYAYGKTEECAPGLEEWAGKVMCYAPQTKNILYLFDNEAGQGADGEVPTHDVLADWELAAIVWKPPLRGID